jgi:hypothetical protein
MYVFLVNDAGGSWNPPRFTVFECIVFDTPTIRFKLPPESLLPESTSMMMELIFPTYASLSEPLSEYYHMIPYLGQSIRRGLHNTNVEGGHSQGLNFVTLTSSQRVVNAIQLFNAGTRRESIVSPWHRKRVKPRAEECHRERDQGPERPWHCFGAPE